MRATVCAAYLLGTAVTFLHPLEEGRGFFCSKCEARPAGPVVFADCSDPRCPDREHHHHPRLPFHDPSTCGLCQGHQVASAPLSLVAWGGLDLPCEGACPVLTVPPAAPDFVLAQPRAPPSA